MDIDTVVLKSGSHTILTAPDDKFVDDGEYVNILLIRRNKTELNYLFRKLEGLGGAKLCFINLVREHYDCNVTDAAIEFFFRENICKNEVMSIVVSYPII